MPVNYATFTVCRSDNDVQMAPRPAALCITATRYIYAKFTVVSLSTSL